MEDGQEEEGEAGDPQKWDILFISSSTTGVLQVTGGRGREMSEDGKVPVIAGSPGLDSIDPGDSEGKVCPEVWAHPAPGQNMGEVGPYRGDVGGGLDLANRQPDSGDVAPLGSTTGKL